MKDDGDRQGKTATDEAGEPLGGERLAEARRAQQIAVPEIAKELHLDEPKVRALERNEFDVLGAPVFAKGHLKKYAQLVGVDGDEVMADYYRLNRAASISMPPVVSSRRRPRRELSPGPWIALLVVVILAVTAYWWFTRLAEPGPTPGEPAQDPLPGGPSSGVVVPPETDRETMEIPEEADTEMIVEPGSAPPALDAAGSPEIVPGQMRMLLTYTGDCWTEISDATGRRLFFDLGKDGRSVELSGAEPFNVLFGSPANVAVTVNGDAYALPPVVRPDRPMRLAISGS
ncbi:MAG: DUF4115 domain-containing protein [Proteobacteria bacterium]|nr:DUF4115 domain-containing protein [Pseudomonadota bacterium]